MLNTVKPVLDEKSRRTPSARTQEQRADLTYSPEILSALCYPRFLIF